MSLVDTKYFIARFVVAVVCAATLALFSHTADSRAEAKAGVAPSGAYAVKG